MYQTYDVLPSEFDDDTLEISAAHTSSTKSSSVASTPKHPSDDILQLTPDNQGHVDFVSPLSHNSSGTCITIYVCIHCVDHLHTLHTLVLGPHHAVKDFVQSVLEEKKPYKRKLEFSQHPDQLFHQNKTKNVNC